MTYCKGTFIYTSLKRPVAIPACKIISQSYLEDCVTSAESSGGLKLALIIKTPDSHGCYDAQAYFSESRISLMPVPSRCAVPDIGIFLTH
ncbi:hypothetical protein Pvag_pPag20132 (plasmid) [Pantoea vagans C9-1]|nr:hypothetical protein Pvag_pPag20132 [Pantoea vagans C9-1]